MADNDSDVDDVSDDLTDDNEDEEEKMGRSAKRKADSLDELEDIPSSDDDSDEGGIYHRLPQKLEVTEAKIDIIERRHTKRALSIAVT